MTLSADLQDPPEIIPEMLESLAQGSDLVIGNRSSRSDPKIFSVGSIVATKLLSKNLDFKIEKWFDYFAVHRRVIEVVLSQSGSSRFLQAEVLEASSVVDEVAYDRAPREGKTQNNFWKRWRIFTDSFFEVSDFPIKLIAMLCFVTAVGSSLWGIVILIGSARGHSILPGWAPLMLVILFTSFVNLVAVSFTLQYLLRIFRIVRNKPVFISRDDG